MILQFGFIKHGKNLLKEAQEESVFSMLLQPWWTLSLNVLLISPGIEEILVDW